MSWSSEADANEAKLASRYVLADWERAPIDWAKYSRQTPDGENSYRCGPRSCRDLRSSAPVHKAF